MSSRHEMQVLSGVFLGESLLFEPGKKIGIAGLDGKDENTRDFGGMVFLHQFNKRLGQVRLRFENKRHFLFLLHHAYAQRGVTIGQR